MRLPGLAWLELIIEVDDHGQTLFGNVLFFTHLP